MKLSIATLIAAVACVAVSASGPVLAKDARPSANDLIQSGHNTLLVMANPVPGKDAEFNVFYDEHIRELMNVPGMIRAQKFKMLPRTGRADPAFGYFILYEFIGSQDALMAAMGTAVKEGRLTLPDKSVVLKTEGSTWQALVPGFTAKK